MFTVCNTRKNSNTLHRHGNLMLQILFIAIMGRKGEVNVEEYEMIAEALAGDEESFCRIEFTSLEYDTSNGSAVFNSLKHGKLWNEVRV